MAKFLNPLTLHLQKLDLELKCPLCLNLLKKPTLLPCNHIICLSCCIPQEHISECPTCQNQFSGKDLRPAPYMENLVTIYRGLHSTITSITSQRSTSEQSSANLGSRHNDNLKEEQSALACGLGRNNAGAYLTPLPTYACKGAAEGIDMREEDTHPRPDPSPASSPSLDPTKDRNFTGSSLEKSKSKGPDECMVENTGYERDVKRQKMLDYSLPEARVAGNDLSSEVFCNTNAASNSIPIQHSIAAPRRKGVCAFCHTSKQTDVTGPMLYYYANGKEVSATEMIPASKVTPVHSKCIDWTPKVYFSGDTIKNLSSELARAAKLKCSGCGKKGAGLGCFDKSCRRTYHAPCAAVIEECRWDCEDFLMLCPAHTSVDFPSEKSKPRKSAPSHTSVVIPSVKSKPEHSDPDEISWILPQPQFWGTSPNGPKQWLFCGSALSDEEKIVMYKLADICGAKISKYWQSSVTHVIASTDDKGACTRTLKLLMGILHGTWILNMGWVKDCVEANQPMNEEPYEISLDNHGCLDGPKTGRLRVLENKPKLFEGASFYFHGDFVSAFKVDLVELVRTAGGDIVESLDELVAGASMRVVVYNADPPMTFSSSNEASSLICTRKAEAHSLVNQLGCACNVVGHKWILDSIAACVF